MWRELGMIYTIAEKSTLYRARIDFGGIPTSGEGDVKRGCFSFGKNTG